jgi:flagellar basal-body rod protein FlgC
MSNLIPAANISSSALQAERTRLDVIAANLANAQNTKSASGEAYRRKLCVFESYMPQVEGSQSNPSPNASQAVKVSKIVEDQRPFVQVHIPGHPHADGNGMVSMPNVNVLEEMVDMMTASRSFEANLEVISTARQMFAQSLKIAQA